MSLADLITPTVVERTVKLRGKSETVHIKELTVVEADKLFALSKDGASNSLAMRKALLSASIVNADGSALFKPDAVAGLPLAVANALEKAAMAVNGLTPDAQAALGNESGSAG